MYLSTLDNLHNTANSAAAEVEVGNDRMRMYIRHACVAKG